MDNTKSCAIRIEGCSDINISNNKIKGFDEAIVSKETTSINIKDNNIIEKDQEVIIDTIMSEMNKRFDELKNDKSNKKIEALKEILSNIATNVISDIINKMIK